MAQQRRALLGVRPGHQHYAASGWRTCSPAALRATRPSPATWRTTSIESKN